MKAWATMRRSARGSRILFLYDRLLSLSAAVVGILIMLAMLLVTIDVAGRYFFSSPIGWVFELTEHILVFVPFLGMAWLVRKGGHVRIDLLVNALPGRWRHRVDGVAYLLCALACGVATYYAFQTTVDHFSRGIVTYGIYPIPKFILIAVMTFGLALTAIEFTRQSVVALSRRGEET